MDSPIPVIIHTTSCSRFEICRKQLKCLYQCSGILYKICSTIEVGKHPFMRIENKTVDMFPSVKHPLKFRQNKSSSGHCSINMEPNTIFPADLSYGSQRINSRGSGSPQSCNDTTWYI